jgi:hypothetical protein
MRNGMCPPKHVESVDVNADVNVRNWVGCTLPSATELFDSATKAIALTGDASLRRSFYTGYGDVNEKFTLDILNRGNHLRRTVVTDKTFYTKCGGYVYGMPWYIGGRVDGITCDRSAVVEIKSRIHRLSRKARMHERVQVLSYMRLLEVDEAYLVEAYRPTTDEKDMELAVLAIDRDELFWSNYILPRLGAFVTILVRMLDDSSEADQYVRSEDKIAWLSTHLNEVGRGHGLFNTFF